MAMTAAMSKGTSSVGAVAGRDLPRTRDSESPEPRFRGQTLRAVGLLLVAGGLFSIGLDAVGAPEALLRFSYESMLSGLDVPPEPSTFAVDLVRYTALAGGVLQLLAGLVVFGIGIRRERG
jgi:hypothetical protein